MAPKGLGMELHVFLPHLHHLYTVNRVRINTESVIQKLAIPKKGFNFTRAINQTLE